MISQMIEAPTLPQSGSVGEPNFHGRKGIAALALPLS